MWTGFATYQQQGKPHEWWITWKECRARDAPQVTYEEFRKVFIERFAPRSLRIARAREFEYLKQVTMTVKKYDTQFVRLSRYAPHMIPDEEEKIRRFVLGLHHRLRQFVSKQMELYPSYIVTVDMARTSEMNERDEDENFKRKRKRGIEGRPSGYRGTSGSSKSHGRVQYASVVSSLPATSLVSVSQPRLDFRGGSSSIGQVSLQGRDKPKCPVYG